MSRRQALNDSRLVICAARVARRVSQFRYWLGTHDSIEAGEVCDEEALELVFHQGTDLLQV